MAAQVKHFDKTGGTQITGKDWGDIFAAATGGPEKFSVQNTGSRDLTDVVLSIEDVSGGDGDEMIEMASDAASATPTVIPPFGLSVVMGPPADGGVFAATGTYGWRVSATNGTGETIASLEATATVDDTTKRATLTWDTVTGATGYKVFRTSTVGTYGSTTLRATLGVIGTFIDDGSATVAGTPASENTTAGGSPNYGTAPVTFAQTDLAIGLLEIGESYVYWVRIPVPAATPEVGNPRQAELRFRET